VENDNKIQGARFERVIKWLGFNQVSLSKAFNQHQSNISQMIAGTRPVPDRLKLDISFRYGTDIIKWLESEDESLPMPDQVGVNDLTADYYPKENKPLSGLESLLEDYSWRLQALELEVAVLKIAVEKADKVTEHLKQKQ
jgi:hypothetical protein